MASGVFRHSTKEEGFSFDFHVAEEAKETVSAIEKELLKEEEIESESKIVNVASATSKKKKKKKKKTKNGKETEDMASKDEEAGTAKTSGKGDCHRPGRDYSSSGCGNDDDFDAILMEHMQKSASLLAAQPRPPTDPQNRFLSSKDPAVVGPRGVNVSAISKPKKKSAWVLGQQQPRQQQKEEEKEQVVSQSTVSYSSPFSFGFSFH
jgi:hypothetical protein